MCVYMHVCTRARHCVSTRTQASSAPCAHMCIHVCGSNLGVLWRALGAMEDPAQPQDPRGPCPHVLCRHCWYLAPGLGRAGRAPGPSAPQPSPCLLCGCGRACGGATAQTKPGRWEPAQPVPGPGVCFRPKTPGGPLQRSAAIPGCLPRMWIPEQLSSYQITLGNTDGGCQAVRVICAFPGTWWPPGSPED